MRAWRGFRRSRSAQIGAAVVLFALLAIVAIQLFSPYDPNDKDYNAILQPPSWLHPFGTDSFGQDVLTRVAYGAQVSLAVSVSGLRLGGLVGTAAGMACGFVGGWLDSIVTRFVDLLYSFGSVAICVHGLVGCGLRGLFGDERAAAVGPRSRIPGGWDRASAR